MKSQRGKFPFNSQAADAKFLLKNPCITFAQGLEQKETILCSQGDRGPATSLSPLGNYRGFLNAEQVGMREAKRQCARRVRVSRNL